GEVVGVVDAVGAASVAAHWARQLRRRDGGLLDNLDVPEVHVYVPARGDLERVEPDGGQARDVLGAQRPAIHQGGSEVLAEQLLGGHCAGRRRRGVGSRRARSHAQVGARGTGIRHADGLRLDVGAARDGIRLLSARYRQEGRRRRHVPGRERLTGASDTQGCTLRREVQPIRPRTGGVFLLAVGFEPRRLACLLACRLARRPGPARPPQGARLGLVLTTSSGVLWQRRGRRAGRAERPGRPAP
ncbi:hypothetical protein, partial [Actinopolymorpha pittospori]